MRPHRLRVWLTAASLFALCAGRPAAGDDFVYPTSATAVHLDYLRSWQAGQTLEEVAVSWILPGLPFSEMFKRTADGGVEFLLLANRHVMLLSPQFRVERDLRLELDLENHAPDGWVTVELKLVDERRAVTLLFGEKLYQGRRTDAYNLTAAQMRGLSHLQFTVKTERPELDGGRLQREGPAMLRIADIRMGDVCIERPCGAQGVCRQTPGGGFACDCDWGVWSWTLKVLLPALLVVAGLAFFGRHRLRPLPAKLGG